MSKFAEDIDRIPAWRCIGCGKLDAPRPCIGVCQDRKVELVSAVDYDRALARINELEALVRMLAMTVPREGQWESSYRRFQENARKLSAK
ncbi:MAG TPA: hypothetical protein PLS60_09040 [Arenimonas sp.]|nr:hypothetical protein [Arenimonas sp.]HPO23537.1 hypothetical protein [Arenimonas sp.]